MSEMGWVEPRIDRPCTDPEARWLASSALYEGRKASVQLVDGESWAEGFGFTVLLRTVDDPLVHEQLTSYYTTPWDEPPRDALRVRVVFSPKDGIPWSPLARMTGAISGDAWLRMKLWVSPLPRATDRVSITVSLEEASITESYEWLGQTLLPDVPPWAAGAPEAP